MANDVNLSQARILKVAIAHTLGNGIKFNEIGTLQALRSPQLKGVTDALDPRSADADKRLSHRRVAGDRSDIIPTIKLNYKQQYQPTSKQTVRGVVDGGDTMSEAKELDVDFNLYRQYNHKFDTVDFIALEPIAREYLKQVNQGVSLTIPEADLLSLAAAGAEVLNTIEGGMLTDINTDMVNMLVAGRAGNLAVGLTSPANMVEPNIPLYNADGTPSRALWEALNEFKRLHMIKGKVIIIGGKMIVKWWELQNLVGMADIGIDLKKIYDTLPAEFYYDPAVDVLYGQDKILVLDPGCAAWQTIVEHRDIVKVKDAGNTSFGSMSVNINQYDSGTFLMDFDLRVRVYDTGKYPYWVVTPSAKYGGFTRPKGFFKNYGGWTTVSGIVGYQLTRT